MKIMPEDVYRPSEDVVSRKIEGETIIIPLVSGIGDLEDDLYTFNETGQAIWEKLDGKRNLQTIIAELSDEFQAPVEEVQQDVMGIIQELARRKIILK
jgi:hypothetical protein